MHKALIKAELEMVGRTPGAIAKELGISTSAVSLVIAGKSKSRNIQEVIARAINRPFAEVWPERCDLGPGTPDEKALLDAWRAADDKHRRRALAALAGASATPGIEFSGSATVGRVSVGDQVIHGDHTITVTGRKK
jgi:lambda repressor-like predicted transcriptional regulator